MTRLGIITNVQAGRNRTRLERIRALSRATGGDSLEVEDLESIRAATRNLVEREVDLLAVNGGDGTAQAVITELMHGGEPLPDIGILPGGTTNLSANDLNGSKSLEATLGALAGQAARPPETRPRVSRPLLRTHTAEMESQYGLFLGSGVFLRGMRHFRDHVGSKGLRGELAAGISVIRGLVGVARGRGDWNDSHPATVRFDDAEPWRQQIMVIATTLERLVLDLRPWWGEQAARIHLTAMRRSPRALLRSAPALMKGRRGPRLSAEHGYRSANVDGFVLQGSTGFALDGQVFPLSPDQGLDIRATEPVAFLKL